MVVSNRENVNKKLALIYKDKKITYIYTYISCSVHKSEWHSVIILPIMLKKVASKQMKSTNKNLTT